jgi:hypothetical protein
MPRTLQPHGNAFPFDDEKGDRCGQMTSLQNLYVTILLWGPAILLGVFTTWWIGVLAFVANAALSLALAIAVTPKIPMQFMLFWAWVKPALVALLVVGAWGFASRW